MVQHKIEVTLLIIYWSCRGLALSHQYDIIQAKIEQFENCAVAPMSQMHVCAPHYQAMLAGSLTWIGSSEHVDAIHSGEFEAIRVGIPNLQYTQYYSKTKLLHPLLPTESLPSQKQYLLTWSEQNIHFSNNMFTYIFLNKKYLCILIKISLSAEMRNIDFWFSKCLMILRYNQDIYDEMIK